MAVCYDLRFPELFRKLMSLGAEIFVVPAAFTAITGKAHWETLVRARAIENLAFVVAAAQGGYHMNRPRDPWPEHDCGSLGNRSGPGAAWYWIRQCRTRP